MREEKRVYKFAIHGFTSWWPLVQTIVSRTVMKNFAYALLIRLPANAIIFAVIAGATPEAAVFPIKINGVDRAAAALRKA